MQQTRSHSTPPLAQQRAPQKPARRYPNGNAELAYNRPAVRNTDPVRPLDQIEPVVHDYHCDGPAPGRLGFRWIHGSRVAATNRDPRIQVVQYNEDTFVLRQNVCVHWEAPFTYLLFGNDGALLIDSGATANAQHYPLRETVDAIIARWNQRRKRERLPLTVALTSGEDIAQNCGLVQFADSPDTVIVPTRMAAMQRHYGVGGNWPADTGTIDLGGRVIEVIPTPGTHRDGVSFYDPYCDFLFTGDLLFPGRINIGNDSDYAETLARLKTFADTRPVKWVMGGHVDMMFAPGRHYPRFATYKPYERVLEMEAALIGEALQHARAIKGKDMKLTRADFVLFNNVSPDQRAADWPADVPQINPPHPF
ncbi:MAG: MBL fold metallo-hydrolase [Alteraurantiacibacter sp.]